MYVTIGNNTYVHWYIAVPMYNRNLETECPQTVHILQHTCTHVAENVTIYLSELTIGCPRSSLTDASICGSL